MRYYSRIAIRTEDWNENSCPRLRSHFIPRLPSSVEFESCEQNCIQCAFVRDIFVYAIFFQTASSSISCCIYQRNRNSLQNFHSFFCTNFCQDTARYLAFTTGTPAPSPGYEFRSINWHSLPTMPESRFQNCAAIRMPFKLFLISIIRNEYWYIYAKI